MRRRRLVGAVAGLVLGVTGLTGARVPASAVAGDTEVVNPPPAGGGTASEPSMSPDGRFVTFTFETTTPHEIGIGLRDRSTGSVERIDTTPGGPSLPPDGSASTSAISDDGRFVAFASSATNLVSPPVSPSGRSHVYLKDRSTGQTVRIDGGGEAIRPTVSSDGRFVVFQSTAQLVPGDQDFGWDVYRYDALAPSALTLVSGDGVIDDNASYPSVSGDGRFVAFTALGQLVASDTNNRWDVYVRDLTTSSFGLVSGGMNGAASNGDSGYSNGDLRMSRDGGHVVFSSGATNLVAGDTNGQTDIFMATRGAGLQLVSVSPTGDQGDGTATSPSVSSDGRFVAFGSRATNFGTPLQVGQPYVYVRDTTAGTTTIASYGTNGSPIAAGDRATAISATGRFLSYTETATWPYDLLLRDLQYVAPVPGHVTGALTVNGRAPLGAESEVGVRACPGTWDKACSGGVGGNSAVSYSADYSSAAYTLDLDPSATYTVRAYLYGGLVLGTPRVVGPGFPSTVDLSADYGTVTGHVYSDVPGAQLAIHACAASGCADGEVGRLAAPDGSFTLPLAVGMAADVWGRALTNPPTDGAKQRFQLSAGATVHQDLFVGSSPATEPAGDINGDGVQDAVQANVASAPSTTGAGTIAVAVGVGTPVVAMTVVPASSVAPLPDPAYALGQDLVSFKLPVQPGASATVSLWFSEPIPAGSAFYKFADGAWSPYPATITDHEISYVVTDGGSGDSDHVIDGWIVDPAAVGRPVLASSGFYAPVDNQPTVNQAKAGSTVPVKWRVTYGSAPVSDAATAFTSIASSGVACRSAQGDQVESLSSTSGLQYLGGGLWQFNWKTQKAWAGSCRTLTLVTPARTLTAAFDFSK
jgi:Tol biopolymer transport system component